MRLISTVAKHWREDCSAAAERGEPFYMINLTPDDVAYLSDLLKEFPHRKFWSDDKDAVYFNPPISPDGVLDQIRTRAAIGRL